jgi:hypothetical protein
LEEEEFKEVECKVEGRPVMPIFKYLQTISLELNIAVEIQCLKCVDRDFVLPAILHAVVFFEKI